MRALILDTDGDGVANGDACDPNPARHDRIAVFEGFDSPMAQNSVRQSIQIYVAPYDVAASPNYPGNLAPGLSGKLTITYDTAITCRGDTLGEDLVYSPAETITAPAGLRVQTLAAYFDYLIVYEPAP